MKTEALTLYKRWDSYVRARVDKLLDWYEERQELGYENKVLSPRAYVSLLGMLLVPGFIVVALIAQTNNQWVDVDPTLLKVGLICDYILVTFIGMWTHWWKLSAMCALNVLLVAALGIGYSIKYGEYDAGIQVIGAIVFYLVILFAIGIFEPRNWTKDSLMYVLPFASVVLYQILPETVPEIPVRISKLEGTDWFLVGLTNTAIGRGILTQMKRWMLTWDSIYDTLNFIGGQYYQLLLRKIYPSRITITSEKKRRRESDVCPYCGK